METMSYPCSPLLPFPTHEETSYFLWSPQAFPHEDAIVHVAGHFADQQEHHEPFDFDARNLGQENGNLAAIQEELMEENSLTDLLLAGAEAVEAGDSRLASVVFSRLDDLLHGVPDNAAATPFDRLAYHFDQGLRSRIAGASTGWYPSEPPPTDRMAPVHQIIQELSPFVKLEHFTANQAILEATNGDVDVHVVDLNIGEGTQWPSLMSDLARHGGRSFHLTDVATDTGYDDEAHHTAARRLSEFAESLSLPFHYSLLRAQSEEDLLHLAKNREGPAPVLSCDTTGVSYRSVRRLQTLLLGCARTLNPKLVVIVEEELLRIPREAPPPIVSFVDFFFEALHHFTTVFESLASCFVGGGSNSHGAWCLRLVDKEMLGPRIQDFVEQYESMTEVGANATGVWDGFRACELSACNVAQARMLVGLFSRGFRVECEMGRLALCWKSRPLTSVSVWAPV